MPFTVALLFLPILFLAVWMLEQLPEQSSSDIAQKSVREPIQKEERGRFIKKYFWGISIFLISYVLMTAYRDFRDNFAAEIWHDLGYSGHSELFTLTEIPVSLIILFMMIWIQGVKDNMRAFRAIHIMGIIGAAIILLSTILYSLHFVSPILWICSTGIGLYVAYVPANGIFFERMIAVFRERGNAGFLVIMADFYGYVGSLGMLFYKNFGETKLSYASFFRYGSLWMSFLLIAFQYASLLYFTKKGANNHKLAEIQLPSLV